MSDKSRLASAADHLRSAYGSPELDESSNQWVTFLSVLLLGSNSKLTDEQRVELFESAPLNSPTATTQASTGQLVERLSSIPRGPQKAGVVRLVAEWWLGEFGEATSAEWSRGVSYYRESLRKIRGLGPATVDELLLFVAKLPVFPMDRGTLRVAVRHGWLDLPIEDEDAQDFFVRGLNEATIEPRGFFRLLSRVAETHCGREPKCDGCPLQPLLPENGPLNPDSC